MHHASGCRDYEGAVVGILLGGTLLHRSSLGMARVLRLMMKWHYSYISSQPTRAMLQHSAPAARELGELEGLQAKVG